MKALVIIPAYNEEENIVNTINSLKKIKLKGIKLNYIVINDGSKDKTRETLIKNKIKFIDLIYNLGIGGAVQTGYKYALYNNYDVAIQLDGDGQHNPEYIKKLIEELNNGNDLVIGSRFIEKIDSFKSTKLRRIGKNILSFVIKICTNKTIKDPTSGFRACNKKIIELFSKNYPIDYPEPDTLVIVLKRKYKVLEIPVQMNKRDKGKSSITPLKSIYYMIKVSLSIIVTSLEKRSE
ncbi:MAG: glycosyltransferase family 2 protein [Bacilli bacterium]